MEGGVWSVVVVEMHGFLFILELTFFRWQKYLRIRYIFYK